jgi:predicted MFS family arabinose efflux permease
MEMSNCDNSAPFDVDSWAAIASAVILGTLGVLSFIIQPALVQGFVSHLGLTEPEALNLAGIEMLGVAAATIALALPGLSIDWRKLLMVALLIAALGNLLSALLVNSSSIWAARLIAGIGHGAIISLSFSFVGLTRKVDRNLAIYLTVLLTYGAIGIWLLPSFLDSVGFAGLFGGFSALLLVGLLTVNKVPRSVNERIAAPDTARDLPRALLVTALAGVLSYNLAQGIAWAVLFLIGIGAGLGEQSVTGALFLSQVLAIGGALGSVFLAGLISRRAAIIFGILGGAACIALLIGKPSAIVFLLAVCGFNILWNFVLPFVLAAVGEMRTNGRMVGSAIAMQMLGLGLGPFLAAMLTDGSSYRLVELVCIGFFIASLALLMLPLHRHLIMLHGTSLEKHRAA